MKNLFIAAYKPITQAFLELECFTYYDAAAYVRNLAYGRNSGEGELRVLLEKKGTCSSKHLLLAQLAKENDWHEIKIIVGIFMMNEENTPGVGPTLSKHKMFHIPEAHCYLMMNNIRYDFTKIGCRETLPKDFSIEEHNISLETLARDKPHLHRSFLKQWNKKLSEDEIWEIREECIAALQE
ncbi:MAG: hypothetical protein P1V18_02035 [Candidatus Gracilibacteria bacterium]|nr:hypothetical protein [Candidatus Gracilibacteria bacterium]